MIKSDVARVRDALREKKHKGNTAMNFIYIFYYRHLATFKTEILFNTITAFCGSLIAIEAC